MVQEIRNDAMEEGITGMNGANFVFGGASPS
jgi:hypothetical protein